jgi:hypothetical protein
MKYSLKKRRGGKKDPREEVKQALKLTAKDREALEPEDEEALE